MAIVFKTEPVFKNSTSEKLESPLLQSKKINIDKNGLTEILPDKGYYGLSSVTVDVQVPLDINNPYVNLTNNNEADPTSVTGWETLEDGSFKCNNAYFLEDYTFDLPEVKNAADMFGYTFSEGTISFTDRSFSKLEDSSRMFDNSDIISSFKFDCPSLKEADAMFANSSSLTEFDCNTVSLTGCRLMFSECYELTSCKINLSNIKIGLRQAFLQCTALENLSLYGVINDDFSVSDCTQLTVDSLVNILNALVDKTGSTSKFTCYLGETNIAKLTDEQKEIATNKNWTLA